MPMAAHVLTPPLREGDHLSPEEFLHRWDGMPDMNRAELIDGIVHMPSPVSDVHGDFQTRLSGWLWCYVSATPGCAMRADVTWRMAPNNVPQPDLALRILEECGGQSKVEGKYPVGAPELIAEISHTTSKRDTGAKLRLYERSGVREYLVVQPDQQEIVWRELVDGKYRELKADAGGLLRSRVFPGLWLDLAALWKCDFAGLAAAVQLGVATPEHHAFVLELARKKG